ncbi:MAG: GDP-mannose 4,6-dehydratase [Candidatus Eremiobacteraeota bacterium]|nr:GDP-mannose 4,6-dehydratase [Candidatus Eremiobacteraeota bacterium]
MRVLVTGANGFVGRYLVAALRARGDDVVGATHQSTQPAHQISLPLDLRDSQNVCAVLDVAQPELIFHLAAQTFVPDSVERALLTYDVNVLGTARLLEAVRKTREVSGRNPRILFTSSAEVYGQRSSADLPLRESLTLHPSNPYAASKAAAEAIIAAEATTYGLDILITRAFNHIGPGQDARFVVASFAAQLAQISRGREPKLLVGNISAQRDFLDVRDVVAAYIALAQRGETGETYNVCSGRSTSISEILRLLITAAHVPVEVREDPDRMRAVDVPVSYGSNEKLCLLTGWTPEIPLIRSLRDIYGAVLGGQHDNGSSA